MRPLPRLQPVLSEVLPVLVATLAQAVEPVSVVTVPPLVLSAGRRTVVSVLACQHRPCLTLRLRLRLRRVGSRGLRGRCRTALVGGRP